MLSGSNFVFPGLEDPPFVPIPIEEPAAGIELTADDPTIAAILDKPTLDRNDLRQIVAYAKQLGVTILERQHTRASITRLFIRCSVVTPTSVCRLVQSSAWRSD